jgi:hypothetical protein
MPKLLLNFTNVIFISFTQIINQKRTKRFYKVINRSNELLIDEL